MRMPRLTRRFSLERMFSVFLATIGRSRATQRSRARRGTAQELFAFLAVYQALCALRAEAASTAGTDPDQVSFTVTLRVARDHAAAIRFPGQCRARRDAISDILADLLPERRDRQCERVKKTPRNTFPVKKRGETSPAARATYTITITKKKPPSASTP